MSLVKVFLTGGDGEGWALDDDLSQVRAALTQIDSCVELVDSISKADIVHTVWPLALRKLSSEDLIGKKVITHLPNDPSVLVGDPLFQFYRERTSLWIAQSKNAFRILPKLGLKDVKHVPYALDRKIFNPQLKFSPKILSLASELKEVAQDKIIIGSFQRDTEGRDLTTPKLMKGPDILLEFLSALRKRGTPIHVLLAGPRRHWLRNQLRLCHIPFSFFGAESSDDDYAVNITPREVIAQLYRLIDLYVVPSRLEGAPRAVLECAACETPILSTTAGIAEDVLPASVLFRSVSEAINKFDELGLSHNRGVHLFRSEVNAHSEIRYSEELTRSIQKAALNVRSNHSPEACAPLWHDIYQKEIPVVPCIERKVLTAKGELVEPRSGTQLFKRIVKAGLLRVGAQSFISKIVSSRAKSRMARSLHVSMIYEFHKPPYGGGNQFFLALRTALRRLGVRVSENRYASDVDVFLLNSNWFPVEKFRGYARKNTVAVVHRIDGPTEVVRGDGDTRADQECFALNAEFAHRTIMQSVWSYETTLRCGYMPKAPCVIPNGCDPSIFYPNPTFDESVGANRKLKLIASSWSDNPRKGSEALKWMDKNLDWSKYEMVFVGRVKDKFRNIRHIQAQDSSRLAQLLRDSDVYFTASQSDPCSNALIEGLSCGLPAIFLADGGHPELVSWGGLGFHQVEEIPIRIREIEENYGLFRRLVTPPRIEDVAEKYLEVLSLAHLER